MRAFSTMYEQTFTPPMDNSSISTLTPPMDNNGSSYFHGSRAVLLKGCFACSSTSRVDCNTI
eukprot:9885694-Karenia_brevis.AAC.1